jgi:hypothetical protein
MKEIFEIQPRFSCLSQQDPEHQSDDLIADWKKAVSTPNRSISVSGHWGGGQPIELTLTLKEDINHLIAACGHSR